VICLVSKHWDVGIRVLGRWHAATVHFLCPREQA
jgi:hypothetical protein